MRLRSRHESDHFILTQQNSIADFEKPQTRYTKSGRINIAYQTFGSGAQDLVYIPGWISNIDLMWDCPELSSFLQALGKVVRVILFDKRGTGLSDRISDLSSLEERMDDIRAVMDAVGSKEAILFGHSEGGSVSALFSATYPERTTALITFGVFAKRKCAPNYPWAPTDDERKEVYDMIENHWGSGKMDLVTLAPSMADNPLFMDWLARYFRSGASPSAALALTKMNTQIDIIDILDTITVPTLLLYRTDDIDVKIEEGKFIADRIKDSQFVEFPGEDHLFWAGDSNSVLQTMISFIKNGIHQSESDKYLASVLQLEVHSSDELNERTKTTGGEHYSSFKELIENLVDQYRGKILVFEESKMIATFSGPSKAVNCANEIELASELYSKSVSQGLHIGEISVRLDQLINSLTTKITEKIVQIAQPGQILITNTINNLLSGTGLEFEHHGRLTISKSKQLEILLLQDVTLADEPTFSSGHFSFQKSYSKNDSLLEDALQCIENNIQDEHYTTDELSAELGISKRQLQRKIKMITNKSPNSLIRSVRLHKAKEIILQDKKSIKEAAYMTGFTSVSYFSTCFKKEFGLIASSL